MSGIYFTGLTIKNYKCFEEQSFEFHLPDGTPGSGLNVLIGENGCGKTAVLEALNYTDSSSFAAENRLSIHDFKDFKQPIEINAETTPFSCKMPAEWRDCTYDCKGKSFTAKSRERKAPGRVFSSAFQITVAATATTENYKNKAGNDSGKAIPSLALANPSIIGAGLNVFYFDKNRNRQLSTGTFKTTFERICDDLNWKFLRNVKRDEDAAARILDSITEKYFEWVFEIAQKDTGKRLATEMSEFFDQDQFKHLGIDIVNLLHPFKQAFFALRRDGEFTQINPRDMGSGVEMIMTLLLLRSVSSDANGGIVFLLDEPEMHLHPKAQASLVELLLEESATKQVVLTTHSPYMIKACMKPEVNNIILRRDAGGSLEIGAAAARSTIPWGPTWGEVNFAAYDLPTVEFHNELYGWLQESQTLRSISDVETFLTGQGEPQPLQWIRQNPGEPPQPPEPITLCSYVRNSIHHPENTNNAPFTEDQLRGSIETMRRYV